MSSPNCLFFSTNRHTMLRFLLKSKSLTTSSSKIAENCQSYFCLYLRKSKSFSSSIRVGTCSYSSSSVTSSREQQSSERAKSVLKLFEKSGFSQTQIQTVMSKYPRILVCDPEKNLEPKIDFLRSVGMSESDVVNMVTMSPHILGRSLKDNFIPFFDLLTSMLGGEQNAACTIKHFPFIFQYKGLKYLEPNLSTLRNLGITESQVFKLMSHMVTIRAMVGTPNDWFSEVVCDVMKIGFDPLSSSFRLAVTTMAFHRKSTWEGKLGFYRSLGFSDEEILSMFRKRPLSLSLSEEKIRGVVEFFVNKFRWSPSRLSDRPHITEYSLEKRIIPRCSVLQLLASRNMIPKNLSVSSVLNGNEKKFMGRYVNKYKDEVPEVLDAYQGKMTFEEYTFDSGELRRRGVASFNITCSNS